MRDMKLKLDAVNTIIVDEADKLADDKFYQGVRDLLNMLQTEAQTLFFSATVTDDAQRMMRDIGRKFEKILMSKKKTNEDILHQFTMAEDPKKFPLLLQLADELEIERAIVFITRNAGVKGLAGRMKEAGLKAQGIHSGLSSQDRKKIIGHFRTGKIDYLVTTDIFARGMDVPDVRYIINYDVPKDQASYIHRSGRTARAGRKGTVITFVQEHTKFVIGKLERNLDIGIQEKGFTKDGKYIDINY
jgi:ATP-dependent RNA helicase RhlE